jgi:hypothetical protein
MKQHLLHILLCLAVMLSTGCTVSYRFNGASIDYSATRTISIADFPNRAALVYPPLSSSLSEAIRDQYSRQTRLEILPQGGSLELEGEITGYSLSPMAVAADSYASATKLTLTVHVRFTNNVVPEESFDKTYTAYQTFDASRQLNDVQEELCNTMITEIAESIFNDTVAKW